MVVIIFKDLLSADVSVGNLYLGSTCAVPKQVSSHAKKMTGLNGKSVIVSINEECGACCGTSLNEGSEAFGNKILWLVTYWSILAPYKPSPHRYLKALRLTTEGTWHHVSGFHSCHAMTALFYDQYPE